jgi:hypothetical protein
MAALGPRECFWEAFERKIEITGCAVCFRPKEERKKKEKKCAQESLE